MAWIDYIIVVAISFSCLLSFIRGFIHEIISLLTWCCSFFISYNYYNYISAWFVNFRNELVRNWIAFLLLFITIMIIGTITNHSIGKIVDKTSYSKIDRILGICFGLLRGVVIVAVVLFLLDLLTGYSRSGSWQQSKFIPIFSFIIRWLFDHIHDSSNFLIRIRN